ncbi:hypothetical protein WICANDRAFT_52687 [Wickerhamomyces anomalus NRRL Y-366-8]|uniref:mRNA 3'-end-processing protein RNA14 n=1 Tax=Wickerhamomyces anomalus (strain ATCC 58044 / CBS 1984 / NCYC 433 / NRRL Y-366-8) TaxID=683960 RepID=A0A1E3P9D7_WICAA|nr:uncharacterized protein WICANDRAFT_52687 [Wickerhamomyces anomalus NRRL Y-366-8]ODQ61497.1 hypothetical protein WICANDRAFT_52687 [Wickerhamomyces anomalus NRRL Y-366-8]
MSTVGTPEIEPTPEIGSTSIPSATTSINNKSLKNKKTRLASDVIGQLEDKLKENDRDISVWLELISKIELKDKTQQVRETYDKFFKKFPFFAKQWINYINYELNRGEFDKVENIFKRCLYNTSSVLLWKTYVNYIRRKNNLITGGEEARRVIFQAYEVAINKVGFDPESGSLWDDYFSFIEDWKPVSTWDGQQKMDMKRKLFKKALNIPLNNLENLWGIYTSFETELSPNTARKFIGELSGQYMNSRSWFKEWSNLTKGLIRSDDFVPKQDEYDSFQLSKWLDWVNWEKSNKLELDNDKLIERIEFVYKQAIQHLTFYPELWFEFANFYKENQQHYSSINFQELLNEAILVNPLSFALNFKLIESYEVENNTVLVGKKFSSLIEHLTQIHDGKSLEIEELKNELFAKLSKTISLTYCQYIKSMKRLSGIKEARQIFGLARASKKVLTHHVFVEVANLEHFATNTKTAIKVFDLGLKPAFFSNDGEYIYKYLKFLIKINDDTNSRSLFETTVNVKGKFIESQWLKRIFKIYMSYELNFGQISSVDKLEKKYFEYFPEDSKILVFADRYTFADIQDCDDVSDDLIRYNDLKYSELVPKKSVSSKRRLEDDEQVENENEDYKIKQYVTDEVYNLLRVLPNSSNFQQPVFNNTKLIQLLNRLE